MARLPDRFDLWVQKARNCPDPARQVDWILGALIALEELHFLNIGTKENFLIARTQLGPDLCVLVYTDRDRVEDLIREEPSLRQYQDKPLPVITMPNPDALGWCVENKVGLVINPREDAVMIPFGELAAFYEEWQGRGALKISGFWIPDMTTEEEDFWQEHGL